MDKDEYEGWIEALYSTSGHKKVVNYILALMDTREFQDFATDIRLRYQIPVEGFADEEKMMPPTSWVHRHTEKQREMEGELRAFAQKHYLHHLDGTDIFEWYIFHNEKEFFFSGNAYNLCIISDIPLEKEEPYAPQTQADDDRLHPIAIRISPYATLRDILDFVKKNYKYEIKWLQDKYKEKGVEVGKFKKRKDKIRDRNDFIYKNRNLPRKEIMRLLTDKYGAENTLDYAYIGKIISLEKKRRKEV